LLWRNALPRVRRAAVVKARSPSTRRGETVAVRAPLNNSVRHMVCSFRSAEIAQQLKQLSRSELAEHYGDKDGILAPCAQHPLNARQRTCELGEAERRAVESVVPSDRIPAAWRRILPLERRLNSTAPSVDVSGLNYPTKIRTEIIGNQVIPLQRNGIPVVAGSFAMPREFAGLPPEVRASIACGRSASDKREEELNMHVGHDVGLAPAVQSGSSVPRGPQHSAVGSR
jgi:hypothetical protein